MIQWILYATTIVVFGWLAILFGWLVPMIWAEAKVGQFSFDLSVGAVLITLPSVVFAMSTLWFLVASVKSFPFGEAFDIYWRCFVLGCLVFFILYIGFFALVRLTAFVSV